MDVEAHIELIRSFLNYTSKRGMNKLHLKAPISDTTVLSAGIIQSTVIQTYLGRYILK